MPLTRAVRDRDLPQVLRLLRGPAGDDVDFERDDDQGFTPLFWAVRDGDLTIVSALLARGAAVGAADIDGRTPSDYARALGHVAIEALFGALLQPDVRPVTSAKAATTRKPKARSGDFEAVVAAEGGRYRVEVPAALGVGLGAKVRIALNGGASAVRTLEIAGEQRFVRLLARDLPSGVDEGGVVRVAIAPFAVR